MTGEIQSLMSDVLLPVCKWLALGCLGIWLWLSFASAVRRQLAKLRRVASPFAALVMVLALAKFFEVGATKTNGVDRVSGGVLDAEAQRSKGRRAPAGISALESLNVRRTAKRGEGTPVCLAAEGPAGLFSQSEFFTRTWNIRGAYMDHFKCEFPEGWVFPEGTNHLSSAEVWAFGEIWRTPFDRDAVAGVGAELEIVPGLTEFSCGATARGSFAISWRNAVLHTNASVMVDAEMELLRNGDRRIVLGGVTNFIERVLPFAHSGFGQDEEWVAANFTNAAEIASSGGYAAWVDAQVGVGLTNGLYKLTIDVAEDPPETTLVTIGDLSVAVTNAGEYVFLLEKGVEYPFAASVDCSTNFTYTLSDDVAREDMLFVRAKLPGESGDGQWSQSEARTYKPPFYSFVLFEPTLKVTPGEWSPSSLSPTRTFTATVVDVPPALAISDCQWTSIGDADVSISSPTQMTTEVGCMFPQAYGREVALQLDVLAGGTRLQSSYRYTIEDYNTGDYDTTVSGGDAPPAVVVESHPRVVFFERGGPNLNPSDVACRYRVASAGTFTVALTGDACIVKDAGGNQVPDGYSWTVDGACEGVRHFSVLDTLRSSSQTGSVFNVTFEPDDGESPLSAESAVTFVEWSTETAAVMPEDTSRKTLGVCEEVFIALEPEPSGTVLGKSCSASGLGYVGHGKWIYIAPSFATIDTIVASEWGRLLEFEIVAPTGFEAMLTRIVRDPSQGVAGAFRMHFDLTLMPTNVSFEALQVVEVGMTSTNAIGYFAESVNAHLLSHTTSAGANAWVDVTTGNKGSDDAQVAELPQPWSDGSMTWPIPNKYRGKMYHAPEHVFCNTDQHFTIDADGTVTETKFGWTATATTNRVITYRRIDSQ